MAARGNRHMRALARPLALTTALWAVVMGAVATLWFLRGIRPMQLFAEVVLLGEDWYLGTLSVLTVLLWASAAGLLLTTGSALAGREPREGAALRALGAFTAVLVVDDAFGLHVHVLKTVAGVPEVVPFTSTARPRCSWSPATAGRC